MSEPNPIIIMKPTQITIHHTVSSRDKTRVKDINDWHKLRWPGFISELGYHVGYHFVIVGDGTVVQTRKMTEMGAHSVPNKGKIGIGLTGNFENERPSDEQLASLRELLKKIQKQFDIPRTKVLGHREVSRTLCPGESLMLFVKTWQKFAPTEPLKAELTAIERLIEAIRQKIQELIKSLKS